MPGDLRLFFVGVTDDAEREWRVLGDVVAPPLARQLQAQGVRLTTERVRLDRTCDVAALRHAGDGALWVVVLGNTYGLEASMEQCRAASVTADRTPSVLDLVIRHVALAAGGRGVTVHVRELPPGALVDRRLLALRAHVDRWGDGGRAERYRVPPELPPPEAMQQWLEQLRRALARLLAARGLRVTDAPGAEEVPRPAPPVVAIRPADAGPAVSAPPIAPSAPAPRPPIEPVRTSPREEPRVAAPVAPPAPPAAPDEAGATAPVLDEDVPPEPPPERLRTAEPSWTPSERPRYEPRTSTGTRAMGVLLMIGAVLSLAMWLTAAGSSARWPGVVAP